MCSSDLDLALTITSYTCMNTQLTTANTDTSWSCIVPIMPTKYLTYVTRTFLAYFSLRDVTELQVHTLKKLDMQVKK